VLTKLLPNSPTAPVRMKFVLVLVFPPAVRSKPGLPGSVGAIAMSGPSPESFGAPLEDIEPPLLPLSLPEPLLLALPSTFVDPASLVPPLWKSPRSEVHPLINSANEHPTTKALPRLVGIEGSTVHYCFATTKNDCAQIERAESALEYANCALPGTASLVRAGRARPPEFFRQGMDDRHDFRPWGVTIGAAVLAAAGFFAARRVSPDVGVKATPADRMAMRREAVDHAQAQRAAGDVDGAHATLLACAAKDHQACECGVGAAEIEADRGQYDRAWHTANDEFCRSPGRDGLSAEILMGQGRTDDARRAADHVLGEYPDEPHALFAKAWALSAKHAAPPETLVAAEKAVKGGRGVPALLLLGMIRADTGDNAGAREAILEAAKIAPNDARVAYDLGVVKRTAGDYHGSREAFLHALAIDPKLADARYGLALLTHSVGADDEARYDAQQLAAIAPGDLRLPELLASLAAKPDAGVTTFHVGAAADAGGR